MFRKHPDKDARLELARASRDFEAGQLARAAARASNAVVLAPALPEVHEMLARLAAHSGGGRDLFPLTGPLALGTVVARAHVVAAEGDFDDALGLLGKAQAYAPGTAWADVPWVTDPVTASSVDPAVAANVAVDLLELLRAASPGSLRPAMDPYLQLIRNTIAIHPDHANLLGAAGYFFRRFDVAEAAGYATRADELAPSRASAIALGYIHRDLGRADEALHAFERALGYDPGSLDVYADIGDLLMDADRLDEALTYARRALAIDPGHICSQVVVLAVQFRQTREGLPRCPHRALPRPAARHPCPRPRRTCPASDGDEDGEPYRYHPRFPATRAGTSSPLRPRLAGLTRSVPSPGAGRKQPGADIRGKVSPTGRAGT